MKAADFRSYIFLIAIALAVIITDQLSKAEILSYLGTADVISVIPGFLDLVNVRNRGAAFGFLNRSDIEWQFWLFLIATIVAIWAIFTVARQALKQRWLLIGLGLILGGAIGNLIDRIRYRAVIDYLDFYWGQWHWPAFNVADIAICCGVFLTCATLWHKPVAKS